MENIDKEETKHTHYSYGGRQIIWFAAAIISFILFIGVFNIYQSRASLLEALESETADLQECMSEIQEHDEIIVKLEADISNMQRKTIIDIPNKKTEPQFPSTLPSPSKQPVYDLRNVLYLSHTASDNDVMQFFLQQWQVDSPLYGHCGRVTNRPPYDPPPFPPEKCNVVVVTSWAPRPCGIATFSAKLVEGLQHTCPLGSAIDVIAVSMSMHEVVV